LRNVTNPSGIVHGACLALLVTTLICRNAVAAERSTEKFYMVIYGAEKAGRSPTCSHCFATFARVREPSTARANVELHHINWFSRRGHESGEERGLFDDDGRPVNPEPGENRTTRDALCLCQRAALRIVRFGPFEIEEELYCRALRQIDLLEGRGPGPRPLYKCFDLGYREGARAAAFNCIHAISDIDRDGGPFRTFTLYGEAGARELVSHFRRWIKEPANGQSEVWVRIWAAIWRPDTPPALDVVDGGSTHSIVPLGQDRPGAGAQESTGIKQARQDQARPVLDPRWLKPPGGVN
jgi:hypothetical protein